MMMVPRQFTAVKQNKGQHVLHSKIKKRAVENNFKTSFEFRPKAGGVNTNSRGSISPSRTSSVEKQRTGGDSYSKKETNEMIHSLSNLGASIMH